MCCVARQPYMSWHHANSMAIVIASLRMDTKLDWPMVPRFISIPILSYIVTGMASNQSLASRWPTFSRGSIFHYCGDDHNWYTTQLSTWIHHLNTYCACTEIKQEYQFDWHVTVTCSNTKPPRLLFCSVCWVIWEYECLSSLHTACSAPFHWLQFSQWIP